jgi:hypothetical protein
MSVLPDDVKIFLVTSLACYDTPQQAANAAKEMFPGLEIDRRKAHQYDPTSVSGRELGAALKAVFFETRKRFLEQIADIGVAHKVVRLRRLERYVNRLEDRDNLLAAAQMLEQAARECGDAFTNTRIHAGPGGGRIQAEVQHRTDRQIAEAIALLLEKVAVEGESMPGA